MTFDELYEKIRDLLPEARVIEDDDGELIVYTKKALVGHRDGGTVIDFKEEV